VLRNFHVVEIVQIIEINEKEYFNVLDIRLHEQYERPTRHAVSTKTAFSPRRTFSLSAITTSQVFQISPSIILSFNSSAFQISTRMLLAEESGKSSRN
jgi:hypothetical protein